MHFCPISDRITKCPMDGFHGRRASPPPPGGIFHPEDFSSIGQGASGFANETFKVHGALNICGALAQLVERRSTYSPPRTAKRPLPRPQWTMENLVGNFTKWGISTAGSALHSHCRGQRFESAMLHHHKALKSLGFRAFFMLKIYMGQNGIIVF